MVNDPWEGCEDLKDQGLLEWFADFHRKKTIELITPTYHDDESNPQCGNSSPTASTVSRSETNCERPTMPSFTSSSSSSPSVCQSLGGGLRAELPIGVECDRPLLCKGWIPRSQKESQNGTSLPVFRAASPPSTHLRIEARRGWGPRAPKEIQNKTSSLVRENLEFLVSHQPSFSESSSSNRSSLSHNSTDPWAIFRVMPSET